MSDGKRHKESSTIRKLRREIERKQAAAAERRRQVRDSRGKRLGESR